MDPRADYERLARAIAAERLPCALVDLDAFEANLDRCLAPVRAAGKSLRIATKSVRSPDLLRRALARAGATASGLMCYAAAEAAWLAGEGFDDLLVAYPTLQTRDLDALAAATAAGRRVAIVIDSLAHVEALARAARAHGVACRAVIDLDVSWRPLGSALHVGARRSPLRSPEDALAVARAARATGAIEVAGLMAYEAHVAGLPDAVAGAPFRSAAVRLLKRAAVPAAAAARAAAVERLRADGFALPLVNGGGTGSIESTARDPSVTEATIGSALLAPHLFDGYAGLHLRPAALFACEVARFPAPGIVTCHGGGYVASGAAGPDRLPVPWRPAGLALLDMEGAGEVQTPLRATGDAARLRPGDPVFFRHAKAGELLERFDEALLVRGDRVKGRARTYRGLGKAFV